MGLTNYARLALFGTALFLAGPAQADFGFTPCVDDCVASSGCEAYDQKCVCKQANSLLLNSVVSCMFFNCKDDLRNADDTFLSPIESGCGDEGRDIPERKLDAAASLASSYSSKLPSPTSGKPKPTHDAPSTSDKPDPPSTSSKPEHSPPVPPKPSTTTSNGASPATSSAAGGGAGDSVQTTLVTSVTPTQTSDSPSESTTSSNGGSGENHNTDPFGNSSSGDDDSAGAAIRPFFALLGLPAAVIVGLAFGQ